MEKVAGKVVITRTVTGTAIRTRILMGPATDIRTREAAVDMETGDGVAAVVKDAIVVVANVAARTAGTNFYTLEHGV